MNVTESKTIVKVEMHLKLKLILLTSDSNVDCDEEGQKQHLRRLAQTAAVFDWAAATSRSLWGL